MNKTIQKIVQVSLSTLIITLMFTFMTSMAYAENATQPVDPCANNQIDAAEASGNSQAGNPCVQPPLIPKPDTLPGPSPLTDTGDNHERYLITDLIPTLIRGAINLLGGITIIALMIAGIQYLTAFGDDTKIDNAKKNIIYALVGLLIAMFSYTIVRIVSEVPLSGTNEAPQATVDEIHTTQ